MYMMTYRRSIYQNVQFFIRRADTSPTGHFAYETFRLLDSSPTEQFAYWTVRLDISPTYFLECEVVTCSLKCNKIAANIVVSHD